MRIIMLLSVLVLVGCGSDEEVVVETPKVMAVAPYFLMAESWDCESFFERVKEATDLRVSILWNTPGTNTTCLDRLLQDPRLTFIEIHLVNDACVRNGNCGEYELFFGLTVDEEVDLFERGEGWFLLQLSDYSKAVREYLFPRLQEKTVCAVNGLLESNIGKSERAARTMVTAIRSVFGARCLVVWNPLNPHELKDFGQDVGELHGLNAGVYLRSPCIANNDGSPGTEKELETYEASTSHCEPVFRWFPTDNCRVAKGPFLNPRERVCR